MADVFISYSRKDKEFVRTLHNALMADGRETWVDWEGIPLSADWWAEIQAAIEAADTFVFIVSPDSVESEVCRQEIDAAVSYGKRIVPIVYRDVAADKVHPEIGRLNWLFFRENDDFKSAFAALMETLNTDLDWLKAHTRLTVKAAEWERGGRNESRLLRGDDLADAEARLLQTGKEPPFTKMHSDYIWASREQAAKRQRQMIWTIWGGLLVALVLAVIAFVNYLSAQENAQLAWDAVGTAQANEQIAYEARDRARNAEATAEANAQIAWQAVATAEAAQSRAASEKSLAQSRKLAADALTLLNSDPELSILLALEGLSIVYSEEAEVALRAAVGALRERGEVSYTLAALTRASVTDLQSIARQLVPRSLTHSECEQYLHRGCS